MNAFSVTPGDPGLDDTFDDGWAKIPPHVRLGITHGVDVDADGFVHVLHTNQPDASCRDCVLVFAPDGSFVRSWGPQFEGSGHGLHIVNDAGQAFAYVTDTRRGLFKTTLGGEVVWHLTKPDFYSPRPHLKFEPTNVAVTPGGDVFLADGYGSYLVFRLDRDGRVVDTFGGPGVQTHHLAHPHGLLYTERLGRPALLIAENIATRLNYLSLDGQHLGCIDVDVRRPRHFDEAADGTLVIPDFYGRVTFVDHKDQLIRHTQDDWNPAARTSNAEAEQRPPRSGEWTRPHDAAFDGIGHVYVVEYQPHGRIVRLTLPD